MSAGVRRARQRTRRVLRLAGALRAPTRGAALGRCLALSLELCRRARAEGIELRLVLWNVAGDPQYCDHWAVLTDDATVVDPTRVQVDGNTRLTFGMRDYPAHYTRPRVYPAGGLLSLYEASRAHARGQLPAALLLRARWWLLRHDVAEAVQCRSLVRIGLSAVSMVKFCALQSIQAWQQILRQRHEALRARAAIGAAAPSVTVRPAPPRRWG